MSLIVFAIDEAGACVKFKALPVIIGDPTEVNILFQNLITNAIKFRKKDIPIKVLVKAERREEFTIKDLGIGIDKKYSERIFDIFSGSTTNWSMQDLLLAYRIVKKTDLHKWQIMV